MKNIIFYLLIVLALTSCYNSEKDWGKGFDYTTVYFAYQYPVRTLTMGEDIFDTTLDNEFKCQIMATVGGGYTNSKTVTVNFEIDNTLCDNLYFLDGADNIEKVLPMPANYYNLESNKIVVPKGSRFGGVEVTLTDDFFNDPLALTTKYVIPLYITDALNVDSVLRGKASVENANRFVAADWTYIPKDYILYAVKYINTWDGYYLRRGTDIVTETSGSETRVRHHAVVEDDEICKLNTISLSELEFPVTYQDDGGNDFVIKLKLSFDAEGNTCDITSNSAGATVAGTGKFVKKGEKNSWGSKDRDALYLDYIVDLGTEQYNTMDTLVLRDRGVSIETFGVVEK